MKKTLLLALFIINSYALFATHILGGSMTYESIGNDEYIIQLEVLRDCYGGQAPFDPVAYVTVFNENILDSVDLYLVAQTPFTGIVDTISNNTISNICEFPPNVCIEKTVYQDTLTLAYNPYGGYYVTYQRCCRSAIVGNLMDPGNIGMTFYTYIDPILSNSSPQFNADIPFSVFAGTPFSYDASATDADGDSLVYLLSTPVTGASITMPAPSQASPPPYASATFATGFSEANMLGGAYPLTIDAVTGEVNAISGTVGVFQIAYQINELRNGVLIGSTFREFTFTVLSPPTNQNYDISGQVFVDSLLPLDLGTVQILERDITTDSFFVYDEQVMGANGTYDFEDIPPGVFYVKAIVDSMSVYYDDYLPTYYGSSAFWYNATAINQCDTSQLYRDIYLSSSTNPGGIFELDGTVTLPDGITPVGNLNLVLMNDAGAAQARTTASNGYFRFSQLASDNYRIFVDLINSDIDNSSPVAIDVYNNQTAELHLYPNYLTLNAITELTETEQQKDGYVLNIYPNPANETTQLVLDIAQAEYLSLKIYDVNGLCVKTVLDRQWIDEGQFNANISLSDLAAGVYFVHVNGRVYTAGKMLKF